jgi:hypothetical protein
MKGFRIYFDLGFRMWDFGFITFEDAETLFTFT